MPAAQQEELQRANDQGLELAWMHYDAELPPRILADNHPVRVVLLFHPILSYLVLSNHIAFPTSYFSIA